MKDPRSRPEVSCLRIWGWVLAIKLTLLRRIYVLSKHNIFREFCIGLQHSGEVHGS